MRGGFSFPLLGFVLVLLARWFGKDGIKAWLVLLFAVGVGDALGGFIKDLTDQHRPCYDFYAALRMPQGASWPCGASTTGMPSNHALNFFTTALFLLWLVPRRILGMVMLVVAVLVALSRIYLGKHYPSQVLVGALLGGIWGMVIAWSGARLLPSLHRMRQAEK